MKGLVPIGVFAVGVLGAIVLISLAGIAGGLLAFVWGFVLIPHGGLSLWRRYTGPGGNAAEATDVDYWRTTSWRSAV